jgi:two-component sensor histidine kinase
MGLVVSEALANAIKHAFPDGRQGVITIIASASEKEWKVIVADNGVGFDDALDAGTGIKLIQALAGQMCGSVRFVSEGGTRVEMRFPILRNPAELFAAQTESNAARMSAAKSA